MPKKFHGENTKAASARARKEEQKVEAARKKAEAAEEEYWRDDDKHVARKQSRKAEREAKAAERHERKAELRALHDHEMEAAVSKPPEAEKVTRAEIEARREQAARQAAGAAAAVGDSEQEPLVENLNRLAVDGEEARNVDEALEVLGGQRPADRHPEKRMRAAYRLYEERELERLKKELPGMRLSQLRQLVHKNWEKSPENPMNQRHAEYNTK